MKLVFNGTVKESGKLHINNRQQFIKDILMFLGKDVTITIEKKKRKRSLSQNAYYWSVVVPMVREGLIDIGYKVTIEQTHDYLKTTYLQKEIVNKNTGEILNSTKSTTELSILEFIDFISEVQQWSAEYLNIVIPDPNEQLTLEI